MRLRPRTSDAAVRLAVEHSRLRASVISCALASDASGAILLLTRESTYSFPQHTSKLSALYLGIALSR